MIEGASLREDDSINSLLTKCITQTIWFEMFVRGVELRVGINYRPDQEIIIEVMKSKWKVSMSEIRYLTNKGAYFMLYFVASLMGVEGFIMDAAVLWYHIGKGREGTLDHVVILLVVRLNGVVGSRYHLQDVANDTA